MCAGAASIELTVLAIGSTPPTGAWLLDGPAARRSWAASCAASAASSAVLELDAPAIHPARSGNTGCFSAHTPGDAPTCVLRHQLSSERRIVLLLQPLHERQALSIRVRGCGQPARRRRTSCAHRACVDQVARRVGSGLRNLSRARYIARTRDRAGSRAIRAAARGDNHPTFQRKLTASIQYYGFTHNNIEQRADGGQPR